VKPPASGIAEMLPDLQAGCTAEEALARLPESDRKTAIDFIRSMLDRGLLTELSAGVPAPPAFGEQDRFLANFAELSDTDAGPAAFRDRLAAAHIVVAGLGRVGARLVAGLLSSGVGTVWGADLSLVTPDDGRDSVYRLADVGEQREHVLGRYLGKSYVPLGSDPWENDGAALPEGLSLLVLCDDEFDPERHAAANRTCLRAGIHWTSFRLMGMRYEIGPTVVPHETPCFRCFELRKASNLSGYEDLVRGRSILAARKIGLGSLNVTLGYESLSLEVLKLLTGFSRPLTHGSLFTFDLLSFEARTHPVLKIPRCPECSPLAEGRPPVSIWRMANQSEGGFDAAF
jgi:ribosomal protein S12 methylthiotransferase accessory factor